MLLQLRGHCVNCRRSGFELRDLVVVLNWLASRPVSICSWHARHHHRYDDEPAVRTTTTTSQSHSKLDSRTRSTGFWAHICRRRNGNGGDWPAWPRPFAPRITSSAVVSPILSAFPVRTACAPIECAGACQLGHLNRVETWSEIVPRIGWVLLWWRCCHFYWYGCYSKEFLSYCWCFRCCCCCFGGLCNSSVTVSFVLYKAVSVVAAFPRKDFTVVVTFA